MNSISRGFNLHDNLSTNMCSGPVKHSRVTSWLDEVQTSVDAIIRDLLSVDAVFLLQIRVESGFDVLNDGLPTSMFA